MTSAGFDYIRNYYGVPAKRGARVTVYGEPGVITGTSGPHIMVRVDGKKFSQPYHPTDGVVYHDAA